MLPGVLAVSLLAGCGAPSLARPPMIIDGTPDYNHTNVVRISWGDGVDSGTTCSGTYIGSGRIVTARHCVPAGSHDRISVTFVNYHDTYGDSAQLESQNHDEAPPNATGDGLARVVVSDFDVAFEVPFDVTAMPILPEDAAPLGAGDVFTAIGFGATSAPTVTDPLGAGYDTRHKGRVMLSALSSDMVWMVEGPDHAAPCNGDSGGPLAVTRAGVDYLVGVLLDGDCRTEMQYIRADRPPNSTFIDSSVTLPKGGREEPVSITCTTGAPSGAISVLGLLLVLRRRRCRSPARHRSKVHQSDR